MEEDEYIQLRRKGDHLSSKPRYAAGWEDELVELAEGSEVRFKWPDGSVTREEIISKPVIYQTSDGNSMRHPFSELATIRIEHHGTSSVLYDLNGMMVHRDDVKITAGK